MVVTAAIESQTRYGIAQLPNSRARRNYRVGNRTAQPANNDLECSMKCAPLLCSLGSRCRRTIAANRHLMARRPLLVRCIGSLTDGKWADLWCIDKRRSYAAAVRSRYGRCLRREPKQCPRRVDWGTAVTDRRRAHPLRHSGNHHPHTGLAAQNCGSALTRNTHEHSRSKSRSRRNRALRFECAALVGPE